MGFQTKESAFIYRIFIFLNLIKIVTKSYLITDFF